MKYGIRTDLSGITEDDYLRMHEILEPKSRTYPGAVAHIAGPTETGWYILEVWESKADHDRFVQEEVLPLMPPNAPMPATQEFEVYTFDVIG